MAELSFVYILGLALVDAINPCALAVMTIVLMEMLLQDPTKRKNVLLGGLAFTLAVFILYFLYGAIIVQFFSYLIPETGNYANYIFRGFGVLAIFLGILNLKDFLNYKPGGLGTEMPMKLRPKVKTLIKKMTSPKGAFIVGLFVTLFLLPCTIGPYLIAAGKLSVLGFFQTIPWLLIYNLIFIIPMIIIVGIIYYGFSKVDEVSGWQERHIRTLHLISGILLFLVGLALLFGWI